MNQVGFVHPSELSIFADPWVNTGVIKQLRVNYRPTNQLSDRGENEFFIKGSAHYIDLKRTRLCAKIQLVKADGSKVAAKEKAGLTAIPLDSLFSQVDVQFQQSHISTSGNLAAYKSYLDHVLYKPEGAQHPQYKTEGYIRDGNPLSYPNNLDNCDPHTDDGLDVNSGLLLRSQYTSGGKIWALEAPLNNDLASLDRYVLGSVDISVKLYPTSDAFRVLTEEDELYKVKILDLYLSVLKIEVTPEVMISHAELLHTTPARYPFMRSDMRTFTLGSGMQTVTLDDVFSGSIPEKLYIAMVKSEAFLGSYKSNPYNFEHFNLVSASFNVNGTSVPFQPQEFNFARRDYIGPYNELLATVERTDPLSEFGISPKDFESGFLILGFNLEASHPDGIWGVPKRGHSRLQLRFSTPLQDNINIILYSQFKDAIFIDASKSIHTTGFY